jgi:hypothetical protein
MDGHASGRSSELRAAIDAADESGLTSLEQAAEDELMRLWGDLFWAMRDALNGGWSVSCEDKARRIAVLTRALGRAAPWEEVQIDLLETGVYQNLHDQMGIPYDAPDMAVVAEMRAEREAVRS